MEKTYKLKISKIGNSYTSSIFHIILVIFSLVMVLVVVLTTLPLCKYIYIYTKKIKLISVLV